MDEVIYARGQMAVSLGFHIVFASIGIAMPLFMVVAEALSLGSRDEIYLALARRWAKGTAVLFAVGAVSGTVLSFELGLLFPGFMRHAGPLVGIPFSLEGFAFFTEAIFLGIYLYGWDKVGRVFHLVAGIIVALSGLLSAVFVTFVNAWMNAPRGFRIEDGALLTIDALGALKTPFAVHEIIHMTLASYLATALIVAAIHAYGLLRQPGSRFHSRACGIALAVAVPCALAQPLVGHFAGQQVARYQPMKLAALEQQMKTEAGASLRVGPIEIPGGLSWLAFGRRDALVRGLEEVPPGDRPPALIRPAFQLMAGLGTLLALHALWVLLRALRRRPLGRGLLLATIFTGPLGFIALEAGWVVTEVGRQPWVIYNVMRTADAATSVHGLQFRLVVLVAVYLLLGATVLLLLVKQVRGTMEPAP